MIFTQKHEPHFFNDLVFASPATRAVCESYVTDKPYKPLMIWGPPGTGKTATARVIVRENFRAANYNQRPHEFNGATMTEKNFDQIGGLGHWSTINHADPLIIINELDELKPTMQASFRAWMDEHPWVRLIVTTNESPGIVGTKQKFIDPLKSRFERVELAPPTLDDWLPRAKAIFASEGHIVTDTMLRGLLSTYKGDVRDMLPIMERAINGLNKASPPPPPPPPKPSLHIV